jgi:hypothetical protein
MVPGPLRVDERSWVGSQQFKDHLADDAPADGTEDPPLPTVAASASTSYQSGAAREVLAMEQAWPGTPQPTAGPMSNTVRPTSG